MRDAKSGPLPFLGTTTGRPIEGCTVRHPTPASPAPVSVSPAIAVALSGGGLRAALMGVGVCRFLADAGLLDRVRWVSAVSGGSIAAGLLACAWSRLRDGGFTGDAYDRLVTRPLVDRITADSLARTLLCNAWRVLGPATRTDVFADVLDDWFYARTELERLAPGVRFVFNAANLTTGVRFGFERDVVGDWVLGLVATAGSGLRVADAVAASGAVPIVFNPKRLALDFPCAGGRVARLVDGGTYDNLGLEPVDDLPDACLIASNAGGAFYTGDVGAIPLVSEGLREVSLVWRQTVALRTRVMVERFQAWETARAARVPPPSWGRQGVLFAVGTTMGAKVTAEWRRDRPEPSPDEIALLDRTPIALNRVDRDVAVRLVHRGWWLTGATLSAFHRDVLGPTLPEWRPWT